MMRYIIKIFVLIFTLVLTSYSKDNYNRDDYQYNHSKARRFFIFFYDPYSGKTLYKSDDIEIDHIVPLSLAHKLGDIYGLFNKKKLLPTIKKILFSFQKHAIDPKEVSLFLYGSPKTNLIMLNTPSDIIIL